MAYKCSLCEDMGRVGSDGAISLSLREMDKRRTLSRSLRTQVEAMTVIDCPVCDGGKRVPAPVPVRLESPEKRQYTKRHPRWSK